MGCGASVPAVAAPHVDGRAIVQECSAAIANSRVMSSMCSESPMAVGQLKVLQQDFRDIKNFYTFGKLLGKGQFGTCRLVIEKCSGERYAVKSISKRRLCSPGDVADVRREVQIMHHLAGHPNIVTIKDVFEDRGYVHLVEELCTGGELFDSIIERGHYSERDAAATFRCIASAVAHCHNMGVMHRDIKPENFLLSRPSPESAVVKGTDFGLSVFFSEGQVFSQVVGSAYYVAPEVLRKRYDKRADIWSLGVLLYILLCGVPPFYAETERGIFAAVLSREVSFQGEVWAAVSEGARDVVRRMLVRDPSLRATAAEVLAHEWVREGGSAGAAPLDNEVLCRLKNFAALNKLQQEALKVIATHLPDTEITGLRALFAEMDADGSGSITGEELRQALQRKGTRIPPEELERIMTRADISGDGTLDYEEFLAATMSLAKLERQENMYMAFKFFDADDSGYISREELTHALNRTCSPAEIDALMAQADSSGDGRIDYCEFCDLMRGLGGNKALPRAARTVKQGLMRAPISQPDPGRLRVDSIPPEDDLAFANLASLTPPPTLTTTTATSATTQRLQERDTQQQQPQQQSAAEAEGGGGAARLSSVSGLPSSGRHQPTPTPRRLITTTGGGISLHKTGAPTASSSTSPSSPPPLPPATPSLALAPSPASLRRSQR
ncbi:hypothetical protein PLESTB_001317600 [Pleodorina starrii]|uniref:Calmodulin n=1 Tax=Pleodorina starrii TaxID=330485 RepID=A0A9W6F6H7_9CHLO|nr:hypothetical protein PLESTM_001765000 [Pleodorina starrii]GLC58093.1 hypothetical protein PLESTB_001317600 [Pleodorina starrii]GLC66781.1 hypothetical protein PLESTF_000473700 [Pleodorina starrii]